MDGKRVRGVGNGYLCFPQQVALKRRWQAFQAGTPGWIPPIRFVRKLPQSFPSPLALNWAAVFIKRYKNFSLNILKWSPTWLPHRKCLSQRVEKLNEAKKKPFTFCPVCVKLSGPSYKLLRFFFHFISLCFATTSALLLCKICTWNLCSGVGFFLYLRRSTLKSLTSDFMNEMYLKNICNLSNTCSRNCILYLNTSS